MELVMELAPATVLVGMELVTELAPATALVTVLEPATEPVAMEAATSPSYRIS